MNWRRFAVGLAVALSACGASDAQTWEVTQVGSMCSSMSSPQVSGANVVWVGWSGSSDEIFLYDGSTTTQLSSGVVPDASAHVSGSNVVWSALDLVDFDDEIFLYNGSTTTPLTSNSYMDECPRVSEGNVVWAGAPDFGDY